MKRLAPLDGLRGIAILLVVAGHSWMAYGREGVLGSLVPLFTNSSLGVRLFFVLSGFLITTLLVEEQAACGRISLWRFYARRVVRIFPAFYAFLGVVWGLSIAGIITVSTVQLTAAATYTWNYLALWHLGPQPGEGAWFLGHLWTLSLEEQFYLFWPAMLMVLGSRKALFTSVALVGLMPLIRIGSYYLFPDQRGQLSMMLHTAIDSIMMGCALALAMRQAGFRAWLAQCNWRWGLPLASGFVFLVSPYLSQWLRGGYTITLGYTLDALGVALLIFHVSHRLPTGRLASALSFRPLVFIGRLSYSWYLWQQLFLTRSNHTWSGGFPASIVCSFVVAVGSHYLIEKPFLRLKRHFSSVSAKITVNATP